MLDGNSTTVDWQTHTGDVCVWAVGSFEQHGAHMPLDTDSIEADFFARLVAEDLDAVLLPTQRFGTCLEQTGFRGSLTLRPETLMQIARDVADEVESQGFRILVLINGHGGNHCLTPVVRDINRLDRVLKIIQTDFWRFCDPEIARESRQRGTDFHASEWETSLMLALRPELVGDDRRDRVPETGAAHPLVQADLTTFGFGCINPEGPAGFPSYATREKGQQIIASIRENLLPHVRDRIARLRQMPRYAGRGGIAVRPMSTGDVQGGMRLTRLAGWNLVESDWERVLDARAHGCFAAVHHGRIVGTVTTICYADAVAWISMMLVDPEFRRLGIATRLMGMAVASLDGCPVIGLDATPLGKAVYDRLGFTDAFALQRLTCQMVPPLEPAVSAVPSTAGDASPIIAPLCPAIQALDGEAFGANRGLVLTSLLATGSDQAWVLGKASAPEAFCLGRRGADHLQIGPVVADSAEDAMAVAAAALGKVTGRPAVIDVPDAQGEFMAWLHGLGFVHQRPFTRMFRGRDTAPGDPSRIFAIAGPDLG